MVTQLNLDFKGAYNLKFWASFQTQSIKSLDDVVRFLSQAMSNISQILTNRVSFTDNIDAQVLDIEITQSNQQITHTLGRVPIGFIVLSKTSAEEIYRGSVEWTDKHIYLSSSSIINISAKIAIIGS